MPAPPRIERRSGRLAAPIFRARIAWHHAPTDHEIEADPEYSWGPIGAEESIGASGHWRRSRSAAADPVAWIRPPVGAVASIVEVRDNRGAVVRAEPRLQTADGIAWGPIEALRRAEQGIAGWSMADPPVAQPLQGPREARQGAAGPGTAAGPPPADTTPPGPDWEPWTPIATAADGTPILRSAAPGWIVAKGERSFFPLASLDYLIGRGADRDDGPAPNAAPENLRRRRKPSGHSDATPRECERPGIVASFDFMSDPH